MRNALKRRGRRDFREVERMGGAYSAGLCRGGITGGCLAIQPGGLLFTTQKIQVPRDKRRIFIPFADLRGVDRLRVFGFPAVLGVCHLPPRGLPARAEKLLAGARNFVLR